MKKTVSLLILGVCCSIPARSQLVAAEGDAYSRGYISRPYLRYEAEPGRCNASASFLLPSDAYSQEPLQAEASNNICASLQNQNDFIEWRAEKDADALSVRFSLPDDPDGKGVNTTVGFYINGEKACDISLDSFWAWQYIPVGSSTSKHPDNTAGNGKFARMRFDEVYVVLPSLVKAGDSFAIIKDNDSPYPCAIDFVELEKMADPTTFESLPEPKVKYEGDGSTLQAFINSNAGKTIYLPEGTYTIPRRLMINNANTRLIGAGMWRTQLYFSADASNRSTYSNRGIESYANGIVLQGFSMNSISNMRYLNNNESMGIGKGLQGSFGKNSIVRDVRIDHFECGAWIGDYGGPASDGLIIEDCRFRNNYADGVNLCSGTVNGIVRNCSFRNNGDDDMASWSTGKYTANNEFSYCTSEHNWRASGLGFFGGRGNRAHHIAITDGLENGARVTADFEGTGFAADTWFEITDLYISRCGTPAGSQGIQGDLWGNWQPAFRIQAGYHYDVNNLRIEHVVIKDSRHHGLSISTNGNKRINNLELHNIHVDGTPDSAWGIHIANNVTGNGHYSDLTFENVISPEMSNIPVNFKFEPSESGIDCVAMEDLTIERTPFGMRLKGLHTPRKIEIFNISGIPFRSLEASGESDVEIDLPKGIYLIKIDGYRNLKVGI